MSRYLVDAIVYGKIYFKRTATACVLLGLIASCGLLDLRPVIVSTEPSVPYATLSSRDDSVAVAFPAVPDRIQAERAFSVRSQAGAVEGDFTWSETSFAWKPVSPWDTGIRYRLILRGRIGMADGREARPEIDLPFYVVRSKGGPGLVSFEPASGASTGTGCDGHVVLRLVFSEPMDERAVEDAFSIRPSVEYGYEWNPEGTRLAIVARESLEPCVSYQWCLGAGASSVDGSPIVRSGEGTFFVGLDATPPRVERVYPALLSGGVWVEAASSLDAVDSGHSIAILFSEPVEAESARAGVRVVPNLSGYVEAVSPRLVVFTPERGWTPEQPLTLIVSADIADDSGLLAGTEYRRSFTPSVPYLRLLGVASDAGETIDVPCAREPLAVTAGPAPEGKLALTFRFSAAFDPAAKTAAAECISLSAFFPGTLPGPRLRDVAWVSDDTLVMTWEGLRPSLEETSNYYRLTVPGGQGGIAAGSGLRDDVVIYLETKR